MNNPCVRRFLAQGFRHNPLKDAPKYGLICLESLQQTVFINPDTGYTRFGRSLKVEDNNENQLSAHSILARNDWREGNRALSGVTA